MQQLFLPGICYIYNNSLSCNCWDFINIIKCHSKLDFYTKVYINRFRKKTGFDVPKSNEQMKI